MSLVDTRDGEPNYENVLILTAIVLYICWKSTFLRMTVQTWPSLNLFTGLHALHISF